MMKGVLFPALVKLFFCHCLVLTDSAARLNAPLLQPPGAISDKRFLKFQDPLENALSLRAECDFVWFLRC